MTAFKNTFVPLAVAGLSFFLCSTAVHAQVIGCRDPAANNYNPAATVGDSSCTYNTTFYTPPVKVSPLSATLLETSGLQWAGNFLWSFNDGGGAAAIYRIDTTSNAVLQTVNLGGATNVDWEDIAFDGTYFYVGDFGNNATGIRTDLKIYKFLLSAVPSDYSTNPTVTVPSAQIEVINFTYSDQTDFATATSNNTKFDCEAMIADGGRLHLFSKNWVDVNTTHYVINGTAAGTYTAMPVETLGTGYLVTAADKVPGANVIALLGYQNGIPGNHYLHLLSDFSNGYYFNGNRRRIDLPDASVMGQAEGITFRNSSYGYISNERLTYGPFTVTEKLRSFNTQSFVPAYVLPLDLTAFTVQNKEGKHFIGWHFTSAVADLQILHSNDGSSFSTIRNIGTSGDGSYAYEPFAATNCYRLQWRQAAGSNKYSNVICADEKTKALINNIVLHRSGALSFVLNETEADDYVFKLLTVDGKLLAQTVQRVAAAGYHTVRFGNGVGGNEFVLVQMTGTKTQSTRLIKVQE